MLNTISRLLTQKHLIPISLNNLHLAHDARLSYAVGTPISLNRSTISCLCNRVLNSQKIQQRVPSYANTDLTHGGNELIKYPYLEYTEYRFQSLCMSLHGHTMG